MLLERIAQEALLLAVVCLMAVLVVQRSPRSADWIARAHLPVGSLEPRRLMIFGAVAGAVRALLYGAVLALRGETLAPLHIPAPVVYLAIAGALVGLVRRSDPLRTGPEALAGALGGAAAGAALGCVALIVAGHGREVASAATALAVAGLGAVAWLRLRRTAAVRRLFADAEGRSPTTDVRGVVTLAAVAGVLLATVFVPTGIAAPPALIIVASLAGAAVALGKTDRGGRALRRARTRLAGLEESVRGRAEARGLTPVIVGIAAGVSTNPAYFLTPLTGFLVEDMGVAETAAAALSGWAFAGLAAGTLLVATLAGRWDQRRLLVGLTLLGAAAVTVLGFAPELPVMRGAAFAAGFVSLASSVALPPFLGRARSRTRASGVFARWWILTVALLLTAEPAVAGRIGWQKVAIGQAGLMLLVAPLMLLSPGNAREPDARGPIAVWIATLRMLRKRRMWMFAAIAFLSGGLYGIFNATYGPILGSAGLAAEAWIPGLALFLAAYGAKWWGDISDGRGREGLVAAAIVTTVAFVAVAPLALVEGPIALGGMGLLALLTVQNLAVESGTTGTTVVGPAVLLDTANDQEANALVNTAKFAGTAGLAWVAASLLEPTRIAVSVMRAGLLGAAAGTALVILSATVPLLHGARQKPRHAASRRLKPRSGSARRWATLGVVSGAQLVVSVDHTIVNVALPSIHDALQPTLSQVPWIVDAYLLASAVALIPGGLLADRIGRRLALVAGFGIFAGGSIVAALSDSAGWLIGARFVMGVGGGLILPSTFSSLRVAFQDPGEQKAAVGIWSAVGGVGIVLGPLAGGALLRQFEWPAIFWVNLPAVLLLALAALRFVPSSRAEHPERIDWLGVASVTIALTALLWGVIQAPTTGWGSPKVQIALAAGLLAMVVFFIWQWNARHPLIDVRLLHDRRFSGASVALALVYFALMGALILLVTYLDGRGYDPLEIGIALTPLAGLLIGGLAARHLTGRFGARLVVAAGFTVIVAGMVLLATVTADSVYLRVGISLGLAGLGLGAALAAAQSAVMAALPEEGAGVGSAMQQAVRLIGGAFGVACLSTVAFDVYLDRMASSGSVPPGLPAQAAELARQHPSAAFEIARRLGPVGEPLRQAALSEWVVAMRWGLALAAAVALLGALVALAFLPGRERRGVRPVPPGRRLRRRRPAHRPRHAKIDPAAAEALRQAVVSRIRDEVERVLAEAERGPAKAEGGT